MAFVRPTLSELVNRVRADIRGRLSIAGPLLARAMADVVGVVVAGAVHLLYGHLEFLGKQLFPDISEEEFLLRQASLYGIGPTAATFAAGTAQAIGTNGSIIPINTVLLIDDQSYRVTASATVAAGVATLAVEAALAGVAGNATTGVQMTFESPVSGVDAIATVLTPGIGGGLDQETIEEVRANLILHLQEPPQGGADQDYKAWAQAVPGVTRVFVYPVENGLGTVVVRFVLDQQTPTIFPDAPTVALVQAALDARRPITAQVTAAAPIALTVNFTLNIVPDTTAARDAVNAELTDLFFRESEPGDGATSRGTVELSQMRTAIGIALGVGSDYTLAVPSANVVPTLGQMAVKGTVTFT